MGNVACFLLHRTLSHVHNYHTLRMLILDLDVFTVLRGTTLEFKLPMNTLSGTAKQHVVYGGKSTRYLK
jgi:hypothetical protein